MGFRKDSWATVWDVDAKTSTLTQVRLSVSRKNKATGEYEQEFSGFVAFVGTANAAKAAKLKERDRIRLGDVDVFTRYMPEKKTTYTNFKCFSFSAGNGDTGSTSESGDTEEKIEDMFDGIEEQHDLPF